MYDILTLNKIAKCGTDAFDKAKYTVADAVENPDAIMVRSAAMHDMQFGNKLLAIARAGAGVNNIPVDRCAEEGIVVFNTPGANANAVKELVIAGLLLSSRKVTDAIDWVSTLKGQEDIGKKVEKGKSNRSRDQRKDSGRYRSGRYRRSGRKCCNEPWHEGDRLRSFPLRKGCAFP